MFPNGLTQFSNILVKLALLRHIFNQFLNSKKLENQVLKNRQIADSILLKDEGLFVWVSSVYCSINKLKCMTTYISTFF